MSKLTPGQTLPQSSEEEGRKAKEEPKIKKNLTFYLRMTQSILYAIVFVLFCFFNMQVSVALTLGQKI